VERVLPTLIKQSKFNTIDAQPQQAIDPKDAQTEESFEQEMKRLILKL
jgi:hypothetical protein